MVPLTCAVAPTLTVALADAVKDAINAVTSVPDGTVNAMFVPVMVPVTDGFVKLKAVMSQELLLAVSEISSINNTIAESLETLDALKPT